MIKMYRTERSNIGRWPVPKKSEARREAILAAAALEFSERGYEGASMSAIVARAGGSKQTIYNHFSSKEELFIEVAESALGPVLDAVFDELSDEGNLRTSLLRYGESFLSFKQRPEVIAIIRLAYGESGRSNIGRMVHERGKLRGVRKASAFFAESIRAGKLRPGNPEVMALHLVALLDAELTEPVIFRVREPANAEENAEVVSRAVDVFLAAYGP